MNPQRKWYLKNRNNPDFKKKRKENHKKWVLKNRKRVNEIEKKYYYKNKKKILKRITPKIQRKQSLRNKKVIKENPWVQIYYALRGRCRNENNISYKNYGGRGIKALITKEEVKKLWFRDKAYNLKRPSIDREDNNGHYTYGNCKFIELVDNIKKSNKERFYKTCTDFSI